MRYLDIYTCSTCPVRDYCGTMVGSIKLCNSYDSKKNLELEYLQIRLKELFNAMNEDYYKFLAEEDELRQMTLEEAIAYFNELYE